MGCFGNRGLAFLLTGIVLALAIVLATFDLSPYLEIVQYFVDAKTYEWFIGDCAMLEHHPEAVDNSTSLRGDIHVVYAAEENSFQGLLSSMLSLSHHLESPGQCVIHVIVRDADVDKARRLMQCFQVELDELSAFPEVKIHPVQPTPLNLTLFKEAWKEFWPAGARFLTPLSFVQLYLAEYLPNAPRVVYLSTDTIVKADLGRLYRMPMSSVIAATLDAKAVTWRTEYLNELDEVDSGLLQDISDIDARTLSNAVMVFDLDGWRKNNMTQQLEYWVMRAHGVKLARFALNKVFHQQFIKLDWRWNVMGLALVPPRRCVDEAYVLHWDGNVKHWSENVGSRLKVLYDELAGPFVPTSQCKWADTPMLDSDPDVDLR